MTEENLDKLKEIFMEIFSISEVDLANYRKLNNPKWDSLASVNLIVAIESEFEIQLHEADYESLTSFSSTELILGRYVS